MPGIDIVIPDITYLEKTNTKSGAFSSHTGTKTISVRSRMYCEKSLFPFTERV